jgi:glycosyltransferase involved in cell wall biosynthesis
VNRRPQPLRRRPTVTVVIPCFNYGRYLPLAVKSVLDQPDVDVNVIVVDDASTDGSSEVVRDVAAADERVRAILHETNRGHIATYNEGLEQAAGEYVVLLSADDALTPGSLSRATALMESVPSVAFTYGFPLTFSDEFPPAKTRVRSWTVWSGHEWIAQRCARGGNCINCPEVVMRTAVQHEIGGYDPALPHSGDLEMWMRAALVGDVGRVNGPAQAYYRVHEDSMQRTLFAGHVNDLNGRLEAFEKVLLRAEARPADGDVLFAQARQALAKAAVMYGREAVRCGRGHIEPVEEYLAFAKRQWPEAQAWRRWRALAERSPRSSPVPRAAVARAVRNGVADVTRRMRWRRWRWNGL